MISYDFETLSFFFTWPMPEKSSVHTRFFRGFSPPGYLDERFKRVRKKLTLGKFSSDFRQIWSYMPPQSGIVKTWDNLSSLVPTS